MENDIRHFQDHGYVVWNDLFTAMEVSELVELFDRDERKYPFLWRTGLSGGTRYNTEALLSAPALDTIVRHPRVLCLLDKLFGEPVSFWEITLRHVPPHRGEVIQSWHRDLPHRADHPLRLEAMQLMIYLTDVDESTHCFSISPESTIEPLLEREEQLQRGTIDLHGPAGTAVLFHVSAFHALTARPTEKDRKSIQIYYGARARPNLTHESVIPRRLRCDPDPETREFYSSLNRKTELFELNFNAE